MEKLTPQEIHQIQILFESLGVNHLETYTKLKDELPILDELIRVAINRCIDINDNQVKMQHQILDLQKEVNDIKTCLQTLIKKWY